MPKEEKLQIRRAIGAGLVFFAGSLVGALAGFFVAWGSIGAGIVAAIALGVLVVGVWLVV